MAQLSRVRSCVSGNELEAEVTKALAERLRLPRFPDGQMRAAIAVLNGYDVVVTMSTAAGKSLCYILQAICLKAGSH